MKSIYLLKSDSGLYKIGVSNSPAKRVKQLQTGNADKITLLHSYPSNIPFLLEKTLQNMFSVYRVNGEWFDLPLDVEINFMATCLNFENNLNMLKSAGNIFL